MKKRKRGCGWGVEKERLVEGKGAGFSLAVRRSGSVGVRLVTEVDEASFRFLSSALFFFSFLFFFLCVCVCVCARARARARVRVCVCLFFSFFLFSSKVVFYRSASTPPTPPPHTHTYKEQTSMLLGVYVERTLCLS